MVDRYGNPDGKIKPHGRDQGAKVVHKWVTWVHQRKFVPLRSEEKPPSVQPKTFST